MKIKTLLIVISITTLVLIIICFIFLNIVNSYDNERIKLTYVALLVEVFKIIIIGFFVSIAIVLIPDLFRERKYEFKMKTSAKKLYAETFTATLYLPANLSYFKTANEALKYLEDLHKKKHLTETYYKYLDKKNDTSQYPQRQVWPRETDPGVIIDNMKTKIFKVADTWDNMSEKSRFDYFNSQ